MQADLANLIKWDVERDCPMAIPIGARHHLAIHRFKGAHGLVDRSVSVEVYVDEHAVLAVRAGGRALLHQFNQLRISQRRTRRMGLGGGGRGSKPRPRFSGGPA